MTAPKPDLPQTLRLVPVEWKQVCEFIEANHRHHSAPTGWKFGVGVALGDELVGVASVGRPIGRHFDDGLTLEVNRTCVADAIKYANSMLYAAAWRGAKALGYRRLITYTQTGESGSSLLAAGFRVVAELSPRTGWDTPSRPRRSRGVDNIARTLWEVSTS